MHGPPAQRPSAMQLQLFSSYHLNFTRNPVVLASLINIQLMFTVRTLLTRHAPFFSGILFVVAMSRSPKRKSEAMSDMEADSKKPRLSPVEAEEIPLPLTKPTPSTSTYAPDSLIDSKAAIAYWSATEPTVNGVLGGYPEVSKVDIQGSKNFLGKLRRQSKEHPPIKKLSRAVDCGAGIGRITDGLLSNVAEKVDIVEPVKTFTDQVKAENVGNIYNVGLEAWDPKERGLRPYDLIWNQWCVGQLTDAQLVAYLKRLPAVLSAGGWIIVKENLSNHQLGEDVFDEVDSSVTRTDGKFRELFEKAGLKVVASELQKGMPADLYPVRSYALQPK